MIASKEGERLELRESKVAYEAQASETIDFGFIWDRKLSDEDEERPLERHVRHTRLMDLVWLPPMYVSWRPRVAKDRKQLDRTMPPQNASCSV